MKYTIPLSYNPVDTDKLAEVLRRYEGEHHNAMVRDFEKAIADYTGAKYVLALNSGTAAIHLGLIALGVGAGDEVLVPDFTYVASVNPVLYLGARPVFIDSERVTWGMDPELLEEAIKKRQAAGVQPKAIIVVHVYGMPAQTPAICAIGDKYGIPVLEDAAEALGSRLHGNHVGTQGKLGILSFNNNKILTTYGGGAISTDDESLYRKTLFLAEQAREDMPYYDHREVGYTYRMGPLNAAMGLAQFIYLEEFVAKRREVFGFYKSRLTDLGITFVEDSDGRQSNRWLTTLVWDKREVDIAALLLGLKEEGIEGRHLWRPMHEQRVFRQFLNEGRGVSMYLFSCGLSLPSGNRLTNNELAMISEKIQDVVRKS